MPASYSNESEVRAALLQGSYRPGMIAPLEDYLAAAVAGAAPYVFDAVRTLVKLYQLFPSASAASNRKTKMGQACGLAFLHGGADSTDLLALQFLIPAATLQEEPVRTILQCAAQTTACQFAEFWQTYERLQNFEADPALAQLARQQTKGRQHAILAVLALSYQRAPLTTVVLKAVHVTSVDEVRALQSPVVASVTDDTVTFVSTPDNTKRQRVFQEGATFTTVSALLHKIAQ